jgi:hypothetical protein
MAVTSWREPISVAEGDTIQFSRRLPQYSSGEGWTLTYEIRGGAAVIEFTSTPDADGQSFDLYVPPTITAAWASGTMILAGYVSNGTDRHQIYFAELTIGKNLEGSQGDIPVKTNAQIMLEKYESVMQGTATNALLESRIGETQFRFLTPEQLRTEHGYWYQMRQSEIAKERAQNGYPTGRKIRPRARVMMPGPAVGGWNPEWNGGWGA